MEFPINKRLLTLCVSLGCLVGILHADGISPKGTSGGLVIPSAEILPDHAWALSYGNYREPRFGSRTYQHNMTFGLGMLKYVEVFGRFSNYSDAPAGQNLHSSQYGGNRDLSANIKVKVPFLPARGPQLAFGKNDIAGGNALFRSSYAVATQRWRTLSASLGYIRERHKGEEPFNGVFGGLEWRLDPTGLSLLTEYDGQLSYLGGRWRSPDLNFLGDLHLDATVQRAFGARLLSGKNDDAFHFTLNLLWPVGNLDTHRKDARPSAKTAAKGAEIPAENPDLAETPAVNPVSIEQRTALRHRLEAVGLERVRVGLRGDSLHRELVVEYENHRYAQNEVDALGLVLGLSSEGAPVEVQRIRVVTLKDGLRVYETTVNASAFRDFIHTRQGSGILLRNDLTWHSGSSRAAHETQWEREAATKPTRLRVELRPDLNYTLGTEVGAFDYSLAARPRLVAPLWAGARLTSDYVIPLHHSLNMDDGRVFANLRHTQGLEHVSLGQGFWISRGMLFNVAVGRFHFDTWGVQSEAEVFVPGTSDVVRLKGAFYRPAPGGIDGDDRAGAVSYRHLWTPENWTEIGWQRYSDGTSGPSFEWTRGSNDVGVTLFGRWGGEAKFAGLKLTVPLTPRQGMKPGFATLSGPGQYSESIRTLILSPENIGNQVQPSWVRDLALETPLENEFLNGGRMSQGYLKSQLYRMREAFYRYGEPGKKQDEAPEAP